MQHMHEQSGAKSKACNSVTGYMYTVSTSGLTSSVHVTWMQMPQLSFGRPFARLLLAEMAVTLRNGHCCSWR